MAAVSLGDLQNCYALSTCKGGLIDLTKSLRDDRSQIKIHDLKTLFADSTQWIKTPQASGHCKFQNKVTNVIVEFPGHTGKKDSIIYGKIRVQLLEQVQKHLNILCNIIFKYSLNNWKKAPRYPDSLKRHQEWIKASK